MMLPARIIIYLRAVVIMRFRGEQADPETPVVHVAK